MQGKEKLKEMKGGGRLNISTGKVKHLSTSSPLTLVGSITSGSSL